MKQLFAVALVAVVVAGPVCAQHGGGGHGGGGGGFHGGGVASRGGFAAPGGFSRPMSTGRPGYVPRYRIGGGWGVANGRPAYYYGGWRRHAYAVPYGYGVGVGYGGLGYGWVGANGPGYEPGYGDTGYYDGGSYPDGSGVAADGYGTQAPGGEEPPIPYVAESPDARNGYGASAAQGAAPVSRVERTLAAAKPSPGAQPSLYDDEAVTLIFKDGRAPETIHNYALTRTTLYVTDARRQEIPVAALDLAATEKVNHAAGVRFALPVTQ